MSKWKFEIIERLIGNPTETPTAEDSLPKEYVARRLVERGLLTQEVQREIFEKLMISSDDYIRINQDPALILAALLRGMPELAKFAKSLTEFDKARLKTFLLRDYGWVLTQCRQDGFCKIFSRNDYIILVENAKQREAQINNISQLNHR
jgi:hypothetical protein